MNAKAKSKRAPKISARAPKKRPTVGARIIEGLEQAIAWTRSENHDVRVTLVQVPAVDVREVRTKMGLSQAQFATKFGFPPATLRNWEQGRSRPDAPTRVLLAVIAKHPEAVEDVCGARALDETRSSPPRFALSAKCPYNGGRLPRRHHAWPN